MWSLCYYIIFKYVNINPFKNSVVIFLLTSVVNTLEGDLTRYLDVFETSQRCHNN